MVRETYTSNYLVRYYDYATYAYSHFHSFLETLQYIWVLGKELISVQILTSHMVILDPVPASWKVFALVYQIFNILDSLLNILVHGNGKCLFNFFSKNVIQIVN